jgi:hypothetical protein
MGLGKNKMSKLRSFRGSEKSLRFLAVLWNDKRLDDYFFLRTLCLDFEAVALQQFKKLDKAIQALFTLQNHYII